MLIAGVKIRGQNHGGYPLMRTIGVPLPPPSDVISSLFLDYTSVLNDHIIS